MSRRHRKASPDDPEMESSEPTRRVFPYTGKRKVPVMEIAGGGHPRDRPKLPISSRLNPKTGKYEDYDPNVEAESARRIESDKKLAEGERSATTARPMPTQP